MIQKFLWQKMPTTITVYTDANWAGCKTTRKSTSAGCVMNGCHTIKSWSRTQSSIATSSAEAELYAIGRGTQEALATMTILSEFDINTSAKLVTDASAALAVSKREGLGKLKHINVQWLWLQDVEKRRGIEYDKIKGTENLADLMTKHLPRTIMDKHIKFMGFEYRNGTADNSLKTAMDAHE